MSGKTGPILVSGASGFIGSHTIVTLLNAGYDVVGFDNFSNSCMESITRAEELAERGLLDFRRVDLLDRLGLESLFEEYKFSGVIHFAGKKAVGESKQMPWEYFNNNVTGTLNLVQQMLNHHISDLVFSSSATVYGEKLPVPFKEDMALPAATMSPYGRSKLMIEGILTDVQAANPCMNIVMLRYFNPIGAHPSGRIGEDPIGTPNNLFPYITRVAAGTLPFLPVYGINYNTSDGTTLRDYIHVMDLAEAHKAAWEYMPENPGLAIFNVGTGQPKSLLQVIRSFERVNNVGIPYQPRERRPGDIAECYADVTKARQVLGWQAKLGIDDMCRDGWNWQKNNPNGYKD